MVQGREPNATRHVLRHILWSTLLVCLLHLLPMAATQAYASPGDRTYSPLFALSLDELVEIRVVGRRSHHFENDGIVVLTQRSFERAVLAESWRESEHQRGAQRSDIKLHVSTGYRNTSMALAIDGQIFRDRKEGGEIVRLLKLLGRQVANIEVYRGESASWWIEPGTNASQILINIVTESASTQQVDESDQNQMEVADL